MSPSPPSHEAQAVQLLRSGRAAEALAFAERAVAGKTRCAPAHGVLAMVLLRLGRTTDAEAVIEDALGREAGPAEAYGALAQASLALGRHERAGMLYRRAAQLNPAVALYWYQLATCERALGRLAQAEAACDRAIGLDPRQYPCYLLRAELRVQSASDNHLGQLRAELTRPGLADGAQVLLGYALGKELDDLGEYDEAFRCFARAARIHRRHLSYNPDVDAHKLRRIMEVFPSAPERGEDGHTDSQRFVFIVGLPRSGTTLLERILTGLPGTRSNGETDNFARVLLTTPPAVPANLPPGTQDVFARAAAVDWNVVAQGYARLARSQGDGGIIIEKQPMNYLYLGAIHRALPRARLLLVSRAPLDSCFSMYSTLFGDAYQFSYDLEELARYYAAYARLTDHWREALGGSLHEVRYDELVSEPVSAGAAAARACGLEWHDSALAVDRNDDVCLTQSAAQVRRPIYRTSVGRWRHYRKHLAPLIDALHRHGVATPELD